MERTVFSLFALGSGNGSDYQVKKRLVGRTIVGKTERLTCHVGGEGSVRSPAGVPAHDFTPGHQGAFVRSAPDKSHRPNRHTASTSHLQ